MPSSTPTPFSPTVLIAPAVAAINHLLAQEAWARDALAQHAGKVACIDAGSVVVRLRVAPDGMLAAGLPEEAANVTIGLKLADLPLMAQQPERAFSYVRIAGDADFANTISHVSKGLRWEAAHDLEPFIGAIAAERLVGGARGAFAGARATGQKLFENIAEFLTEEQPLLVRPSMVDEFGADVSRLRDDVERTAKRLARLEQATAPATSISPAPSGGGQQTLDI